MAALLSGLTQGHPDLISNLCDRRADLMIQQLIWCFLSGEWQCWPPLLSVIGLGYRELVASVILTH